jgi:CHAT domain-containing protein
MVYTKLLSPAQPWIEDKKLIIIPDGELGYLSFDALISKRPSQDATDYRKLNYLLFNYPISYSSSATILFRMKERTGSKISQRLLAFAPTYSTETDGSTLRSSDPGIDSLRLLPIIGVEEEVAQIMKLFKGKKYTGELATEKNFKENAGKYNVLHLAMHTLVDDENPLFSKMVFTSGGAEDEDGLLNTYELFSMDLGGTLGVLSACNTGSGKLQRGEGIMSLARGFIYAGIPSLVMTLWEIEDQSSSDIMTAFYEYLDQGFPTDIAMQQAKIEYLDHTDKFKSHPTYWSGFVNIGESTPVLETASILNYWWVMAIFAILLLIIFINRQVYRNKKSD